MGVLDNVFHYHSLLIQFSVICALLFIADFFQKRLNSLFLKRQIQYKFHFGSAFFVALSLPLSFFIWWFGLGMFWILAIDGLSTEFWVIHRIGVILIIVWFLLKFIIQIRIQFKQHKEDKDERYDHALIDAVTKFFQIFVILTALLMIMKILGYSISGALAFGGIGGIAIGFAAKDLLANFFGGLVIYLDRPFGIGDWICSPDREIEGVVSKIGWRLTVVTTFEQRPLYIPNSIFLSITVENPSRMTNRRIYETIGIRPEDFTKMSAVIADVKKMLETHHEIDQDQTLIVNLNKISDLSIDFFVYTFTKTTDWTAFHEIKQDVLLQILDIIARHGAKCAQQVQLSMNN